MMLLSMQNRDSRVSILSPLLLLLLTTCYVYCYCFLFNPSRSSTVVVAQAQEQQAQQQRSTSLMSTREKAQMKSLVTQMFDFGFNSYMEHAFPRDELKPISCSGMNTWGNYSLTLIDSLDTLYVMGKMDQFRTGVDHVINHVSFSGHDTDAVSVFETNIRVLGGLLTTHLLLKREAASLKSEMDGTVDHDGEEREEQRKMDMERARKVLSIALDLGNRLLRAFDTPTGIPYGAVNLVHGVAANESNITSVAGAGTYLMEFGVLSVLTGNCSFMRAAERSLIAMFNRRSSLNLLGNHINIIHGQWTHRDAGIGANVDSIYEYMFKGYLLFGLDKLYDMFDMLYRGVMENLFKNPWYFEVDMFSGGVTWPLFNSLQAFWPGMQALMGRDLKHAINTVKAFHGVWRRYGCVPEGWNVNAASPQPNQRLYPLRPELAESIYHLYRITKDPTYLFMARDIVKSLSTIARTNCGYATIADVETHALEDRMESFFLSETLKYLYLIFDEENQFHQQDTPWTFTTEAHLIPLDPIFQTHHCTTESPLYLQDKSVPHATHQCLLQERDLLSAIQLSVSQLSFNE